MDFLQKNKMVIAVAAGALVLLGGYFAFFGGQDTPLLQTTSGDTASPVTRELLLTLGDLRAVRLDESVFANTVFRDLVDFGIEIPLQPIGRRNPFEALSSTPKPRTATTTPAR